jgi:oligogalacturonide lyase
VETVVSRRIGLIPPPHFGRFLQPTLSYDGRALTLGLQRDKSTWEIGMMDVETGEYRIVLRQGFDVSHIQHSPTDPLIFYAWETGGYAPQRTWVVNPDGSGNRPLYYRAPKKDAWVDQRKELITHESWVLKTGDMTMVSIKVGILLVNKKGEGRMIAEGDYNHCAAQPDGKRVVADDVQGRLWLLDVATGAKRLLATGLEPWKLNGFHPHATFDLEGRRIIFNTAHREPTVAMIDLATLPPDTQPQP